MSEALQQGTAKGRSRSGIRMGALLAVSTGLLTVAMIAAIAKVVSDTEFASQRVAQAHDIAAKHPWRIAPLQSAELADRVDSKTRIAMTHSVFDPPPDRATDAGVFGGRTIPIPPRRPQMPQPQAPQQTSDQPQRLPAGQTRTQLVAFDNAPFPSDGSEAYSDSRVLLHIPSTFDASRPGVMVLFFHGHRATLTRDVWERQQVPAQISASGMNAVLVAPQFAVAASDSNPGRLGEAGGFKRFIDEAGKQLAKVHGDPAAARSFANMPVVIVAYSGGFVATALSLHHGGAQDRIRGVVVLDGLYGSLDKFANWIENNRGGFFVSSYTGSTRRRNVALMRMLEERGITYSTSMTQRKTNVAFLATDKDEVNHTDFVTHAWVESPIVDVLQRQAHRLVPTTSQVAQSRSAAPRYSTASMPTPASHGPAAPATVGSVSSAFR